jgi:hypothetical protein
VRYFAHDLHGHLGGATSDAALRADHGRYRDPGLANNRAGTTNNRSETTHMKLLLIVVLVLLFFGAIGGTPQVNWYHGGMWGGGYGTSGLLTLILVLVLLRFLGVI